MFTHGAERLWRCPLCAAVARTTLLAPRCLGTAVKEHGRQIMFEVAAQEMSTVDESRQAVLA